MKPIGGRRSGCPRAIEPLVLGLVWALAWACPSFGHALSVSQGTLQVDGNLVRYELRMPLTEAPEGPERRDALLDAFAVRLDGEPGERSDERCREDPGQGVLACQAAYHFADEPDKVEVRCDFPAVTVPHHIHILQSGAGEVARQTVFDITLKEAEIRFTPPTYREVVSTALAAGARRAFTSPELLLFLVALALAGRSRRELASCVGAFLAAQGSVAVMAGMVGWMPPSRFLEAAAALTVAYLASEVLFLPESTSRWLVCGAMGCFHGLFFAAFLDSARMVPQHFLPGALGVEALLALALGALRLRFAAKRGEQLVALLLLVGGLSWFGLRLID